MQRLSTSPSSTVPALLAGWLMACPGLTTLAAQVVVPVHEEPRHRLVHSGVRLQVLDIGIQPGDTTLFHRHDRPIAYVEIDATVVNQQRLGGPWGGVSATATPPARPPGRVSWNERYGQSPVEHRVTAIGPGPFRLIGVVNLGEGGPAERVGQLGPFPEPDDASRYFSRTATELATGDSWAWPAGDTPVVIVLAAGEISVDADDAEVAAHLVGAGAFTVLAPGKAYRIRNAGTASASLSIVEVR
ncbi:MAG: hypothetical protein HKN73_15160 [Gemmatimonadetes bacterium]|nr:hypothetical protein [Gemmatimonadota bacterium]